MCEGMRGPRSVCGWGEWRGSVCVRVSGWSLCVCVCVRVSGGCQCVCEG